MSWLTRTWDTLSDTERQLWQMTVWAAVLYLIHFDLYALWYIEDAAISFAFARNIAIGEGLVAFAGGEPVEGFSNPTWTLSLAAFQWLGLTPFASAKVLGAVCGVLTLPMATMWTLALQQRPSRLAGLTPLLLAVSPQFVAWNASGLENCFFSLFLAAGSLCVIRQMKHPDCLKASGLCWACLAITRPEGLAYVLIGLGLGATWMVNRHGFVRCRRWLGWLVISTVLPLLLWHLWRYNAFGWELPNTYYAKLGESRFAPWEWDRKGWKYLRRFGFTTAHAFLIPLYIIGQTGLTGKRPVLGLTLCAAAYLLTIPGLGWLAQLLGVLDISWDDPVWLIPPRIGLWACVLTVTPMLGLTRVGAGPRTLAWAFVSAVLCYTLYVGGDWMAGFRWLSFLIVPLLVLLTDSIISLYALVRVRQRWLRYSAMTLATATPIIAAILHTGALIGFPETSPYDVRRRVLYIETIRQQLDLDHITQLEVDMGAHLWWGDAHYIDLAGLTDVPMGHHQWERPFIREYVYQEIQPEFAHVHGGWSKKTKMRTHSEWRDYLEMTPYAPNVWNRHVGNFIRRDLVFQQEWPGSTKRFVRFGESVELVGWHAPSLPLTPGHELRITLGWRRGRSKVDNFRAYVYIANDDAMVLNETPPLYDWIAPRQWARTEIAMSQHHIALPPDMPLGRYDLGIFVISDDQQMVLPLVSAQKPATGDAPRVAVGEARWPNAIGVVSPQRRDQVAAKKLQQMIVQIQQGHCKAATGYWKTARNYYPPDHQERRRITPTSEILLARCFATLSTQTTDPTTKRALLREALRWNHHDDDVLEIAQATAEQARLDGERLLQSDALDDAYAQWALSLTANPNQPHLRRRTETLRDQRHHATSAQ